MDMRTVFILLLGIAATRVYAEVVIAVDECYSCTDSDSNLDCRQNVEQCDENQLCQTVIEKDNDKIKISKRCADIEECGVNYLDNHRYCAYGTVKESCTYCCAEELCNDELPCYHEVFDGCGPWSGWSSCYECTRDRTRTCGEASKSKSGSKSGSRARRDEDENEDIRIVDAERMISRVKRGSKSGEYDDVQTDNCCENSCYTCAFVISNPLDTTQITNDLNGCTLETCSSDEGLCQTEAVYLDGELTITKGCASSDTCNAYESSEQCPSLVENDAEASYIALQLINENIQCSLCCDNGDGDDGVTCNSGIVPPPQYTRVCSGAFISAGSFLATVTMSVFVRVFVI
ncbi:uncharacterized protein LOC144353330 [Saccoglossus kowalevskii]